jgi:hypothetical protein
MTDITERKAPMTEEKPLHHSPTSTTNPPAYISDELTDQVENDLFITSDELANVQEAANHLSLDETRAILRDVIQNHENDQNFPILVLDSMKEFIANDDIFSHPEKYEKLIAEMRVEAALIQNDSPYPEVRAVS